MQSSTAEPDPPAHQVTKLSAIAERTFFIRPDRAVWYVEDDRGDAGGIFTTLDAALAFARGECARAASVRLVVGGAATARAA